MRIISSFEALPVELIADVLSELDLDSLITVSYLSRRLRETSSDPALNPWKKPILRCLHSRVYPDVLRTLSVRTVVPRQNWLDILTIAIPDFLLWDSILPNLSESQWEEAFRRRFLPGWVKWRRDGRWRAAFLRMLSRMSHRSSTFCTAEESSTKYIVLNRNGSANQLQATSRSFDPLVLFNEMKLQSNLMHLETHVRLVVQLADVRVLALGVLNKPRSSLSINENARIFLRPPEHVGGNARADSGSGVRVRTSCDGFGRPSSSGGTSDDVLEVMRYPQPALSHKNYPRYTLGGKDRRWIDDVDFEEEGVRWVGGLLIVAQLLAPGMQTHEALSDGQHTDQDFDLVVGQGRAHYASFTWDDLDAIAPWMRDRIVRRIDGPGLGI